MCEFAYIGDRRNGFYASLNIYMADSRRGRPIQYDREEALQKASELFWSAGFSGTSLDSLSEATRMTRPSLAAAFGDKEALYLETLKRYRDEGLAALQKNLNGERPLKDELARVLRDATKVYLAPGPVPYGCLLIGTASVEAVQRPAVRQLLRESLGDFNAVLQKRFEIAIAKGELDARANAAELASILSAIMHSLAVRARAGESRQALDRLSRAALGLIAGD